MGLGSILNVGLDGKSSSTAHFKDALGSKDDDRHAAEDIDSGHADGHVSNHKVCFHFQYVEGEETVTDQEDGEIANEHQPSFSGRFDSSCTLVYRNGDDGNGPN